MTFKIATHRSLVTAFVPIALAAAGISPAQAQPGPEDNPNAPQDPYDHDQAEPVGPATPQPATQPPAPPTNPPPVQAQQAATGQWVYTQQYGWVWMPYGDQYVYSPENATGTVYPYEYVYAQAYGWEWVTAPWIWGWGPELYFGVRGPGHFRWYHGWGHGRGFAGHGVIRAPGFHGGFHGRVGGGHFSGGHFSGGHFGGGHFSGGHFGGGHFGGGHFGGGHFGGGHAGGHGHR